MDAATDTWSDAAIASPPDAPADSPIVVPPSDATPIDLDLGHVTPVDQVLRSGNAAVTKDVSRHWVLWDLAARTQVASGDLAPCPPSSYPPCPGFTVGLAGATLAVRGPAGIELRAAATGERLTTLPDADNAGLASDGSYAWIATASRLQARSRSDAAVVDVAGDYRHAAVFAAPDQIRAVAGPAGSQVLETISMIDGHATTVPFTGTFASWFDDGRRFLTVVGTVVSVFTSAGVREALGALPTVEGLTGQGDFLWTFASGTLRVYAASDLSAPRQTFRVDTGTVVFPAGPVIGVLPYGVEHLDLVTLGATIEQRELAVPAAYLTALGGDSTGHWVVGDHDGAVFDGDAIASAPGSAQSLSLGRPCALVGSPGGTAVLGTGSRRTAVLTLGETDTAVRVLDVPAFQAGITADESTLVAADDLDSAQYHDDRSLRAISLASGAVTHTWPLTFADRALELGLGFAPASGTVTYDVAGQYRFSDLHGAPLPAYGPSPSDQSAPVPHLAPDGVRAAFTVRGPIVRMDVDRNYGATTQLYRNGALVGAVNGVFQAWLDRDRVAVATYRLEGAFSEFDTMTIYDGEGTPLGPARLPDPGPTTLPARAMVISIDGSLAYLPIRNAVYDMASGAVVWQGTAATRGTVVGHHVVYTRGTKVYRTTIAVPGTPRTAIGR